MNKTIQKLLLLPSAALVLFNPVFAQTEWPNKPITVVVPFVPGGGGDTLARLVVNQVVKDTNWTMVIENRPGAGGNIGTASVAKAKPDGYVIGYGTLGTHGINHFLFKDTGSSLKDFQAVTRFTTIAAGFVVNKDAPYKNVSDFIAAAKANPGQLTCGSAGNGTTSHIACEMLMQQADIKLLHVPYKGGSAAVTDLIGGRIDMLIDVAPNISPMVRSGQIRLLAVTSDERIAAQPDVPTMKEAGLPDYSFIAWDGLFVPQKTDPDIVKKLNTVFSKALLSAELTETMKNRGADTAPLDIEKTTFFVNNEYERLKHVVEKSGAKVD